MATRISPWKIVILVSTIFLIISCRSSDSEEKDLIRYWENHSLSPLDYVVDKFAANDWVFLGEYHRIKHDVDLVAALVPVLHERTDVRVLAWEFLTHEATEQANNLVTAAEYDRREMISFFRNQFPAWSYEEYLDILRAVWESNQRFAAEKGPFLFVGLHPSIRWDLINYGTDDEAKLERDRIEQYDELMARWLEEDVLSLSRKALVYTGIAHSTGKYKEYYVGQGGRQLVRMGNFVYKKPYMEKMFFIAFHAPFYDSGTNTDIYPFDGTLDRLMKKFRKDIGFDIVDTPFSDLIHEKRSEFSITAYTFGEIFDGYIMFKTPLKEFIGMTCIQDWFETEADFEHYWKNISNKEASLEFSKIPFEEFKKSFCSDNPNYGEGFSSRFRRLPDID